MAWKPEYNERRRTPERRERDKKLRRTPKYQERRRRTSLLYRYGLSVEDFNRLLIHQLGRCSICGEEFENTTLNVDHCHDSGVVRGLLCWRCNVVLGKMNDDPARLRDAAAYLENPPAAVVLRDQLKQTETRSNSK